MANGDGNGDGQRRWQLQWPTVMEMAMANSKGGGDGNGWWQCNRDGHGNGQRQPQWQWPTAMAMAMGDGQWAMGNGDGNGNKEDDGDGDGDGDCNGNDHGKGNNDKGRVASSCAGDVQHCGRGDTLPPPPWTQRSVNSPALCHGGDAAKSVCSLSRGRVPDNSQWIFFFTSTVQFTEQPSVCPPHYSGAQEPCQSIDSLPPPLLFHIFAKVSLGGAWIVCLQHAALWQGWRHSNKVPKSTFPWHKEGCTTQCWAMGAATAKSCCSRPFCPKLEIQHDRRGRGVPSLTIRREEKMVL